VDCVFRYVFIAFNLKFDGPEYLKVFGFKFAVNSSSNISDRHNQKMIWEKSLNDFLMCFIYHYYTCFLGLIVGRMIACIKVTL